MPEAIHPSIAEEAQKLEQDAEIWLFELDYSMLPGESLSEPFRFFGELNELGAQVVFGGKTYTYLPCSAEGFEWQQQGTLPHPTFTVANVQGALTSSLREHADLVGCRVSRIRTYVKHLDAVNFPGGVNPTADPTATHPIDVFFVHRKIGQNDVWVKFELAPIIEVQGVKLPRRQFVNGVCMTRYRSPECGYDGDAGWFDRLDNPVGAEVLDECGQRLSSCNKRFPEGFRPAPVIAVVWHKSSDSASVGRVEPGIPYGGFPGAGLRR